jgi:pimeloyl-ACP methyl ester carboxylesterase
MLHGFPQTSYQFRKVIPLLSSAGYRVLAPDYRGAGESSKPSNEFTKAIMAADIIALLDHLEIDEPVHVVGHDVGGLIAFVLATRWPERVASACFGECFLPGTEVCQEQLKNDPVNYFHFAFHRVSNLPEALVQGREKLYIDFFINKHCHRIGAFSPAHIERYTHAYSQPGSLRCAFELFRAHEKDVDDTSEWVAQHGKCNLPCMVFSGEYSSYSEYAESMALEVVEKSHLTTATVRDSGHFVAEENPSEFSQIVLKFIWRQGRENLPTY